MSSLSYNRFFLNATVILVFLHWLLVGIAFTLLPDSYFGLQHINTKEVILFYKGQIWIPPVTITLLSICLLWLSYNPQLIRFMIVHNKNITDQISGLATVFIRGTGFMLTLLFITWSLHQLADGFGFTEEQMYPIWILILLMFIGMMLLFYRAFSQHLYQE